jgi:putative flippase GtrA
MELSWPAVSPLIRYGIVGFLTNLAGYLVYLLVTWLWLEPKLAVTLLYPVGVVAGYFGHARYSFAYRGRATSGLFRYLIAHALGYSTNVSLLYVFSDLLHLPHQAVQACAILIVAGFLFLLFKFFVFPPAHGGGRK